MAQRYIYLSDELNARLKQEENASGLIQQLLAQHYELSKKKSKAEIRQQILIKKIELEAIKKIEEAKKCTNTKTPTE